MTSKKDELCELLEQSSPQSKYGLLEMLPLPIEAPSLIYKTNGYLFER